MGKKKNTKRAGGITTTTVTESSSTDLIWVDPNRVRFQHSRIRPYFSGCGRSVHDTLEALRQGQILPHDIPPIQVIVGAPAKPTTDGDDDQGPWYFSLNNRRLWVFKRLREEGLLPHNQIAVRVRAPKSQAEKDRYCLENCALEATLMREQPPNPQSKKNNKLERKKNGAQRDIDDKTESVTTKDDDEVIKTEKSLASLSILDQENDDSSSDDYSDDEEQPTGSNRFNLLG